MTAAFQSTGIGSIEETARGNSGLGKKRFSDRSEESPPNCLRTGNCIGLFIN